MIMQATGFKKTPIDFVSTGYVLVQLDVAKLQQDGLMHGTLVYHTGCLDQIGMITWAQALAYARSDADRAQLDQMSTKPDFVFVLAAGKLVDGPLWNSNQIAS